MSCRIYDTHEVSFNFCVKGNWKSSHGLPNTHATSLLQITQFSDWIHRRKTGAKFSNTWNRKQKWQKLEKILGHICVSTLQNPDLSNQLDFTIPTFLLCSEHEPKSGLPCHYCSVASNHEHTEAANLQSINLKNRTLFVRFHKMSYIPYL